MNDDINKIVSVGQIGTEDFSKRQEPDCDDLPVIATRDTVTFPNVTFPIMLGRESSVRTATEAADRGIPLGIFCQRDAKIEAPRISDLYEYGVVADVHKVLKLPDGTSTAILSARGKVKLLGEGAGATMNGALSAKVKTVKETAPRATDREFAMTVDEIRNATLNILRAAGDGLTEMGFDIQSQSNLPHLVNFIATHAPIATEEKMDLLRCHRIKDRASKLLGHLAKSEHLAQIRSEIMEKARRNINEQQRNAFLHHQFDVIREELYGDDDDCEVLMRESEHVPFPEAVRATFNREIEKLRRLPQNSSDYSVQHTYLRLLLDLPWKSDDTQVPLFWEAEQVLDDQHYGLEKVKERILEQLAVMMNNPEGRSPILCLVGAPGVGKTSLGQSIASALGRKYQRVSLGGLHDEAEIRGHRRTYVGAMPGRIIDAMRRAGTTDPVLLLDEIDKTGNDYKGDPSSALLEVLDPEQNSHFHDNYVDVDYDLSKVLFIATANTLSTIPRPLLDRMEVISISGYLLEEKIEIAKRHLVPRLAEIHKLEGLQFTSEALSCIIERYTSESGVRQLEKCLAKAVRKIILAKMRNLPYSLTVEPQHLRDLLGVEPYIPERYEAAECPGVATGLAWTAAGGEILFIESSVTSGKGDKLTVTGNLGDVMKESAVIALQVVRSYAHAYSLEPDSFDDRRIHIHVPEGAIPKDGPSAGITMCVSILSALTGRRVRPRLAMTGEITLRGKVLPVGGIKEKILAAKRAGVTDIILCSANRKDIEDIKPDYQAGLTIHYVDTIDQVFELSLS